MNKINNFALLLLLISVAFVSCKKPNGYCSIIVPSSIKDKITVYSSNVVDSVNVKRIHLWMFDNDATMRKSGLSRYSCEMSFAKVNLSLYDTTLIFSKKQSVDYAKIYLDGELLEVAEKLPIDLTIKRDFEQDREYKVYADVMVDGRLMTDTISFRHEYVLDE